MISDIGFGQAFGDLAADKDVDGYIAASENTVFFIVILCATGLMPVLQWPPLARIIGPSEGGKSGVGKVMTTARRLIDERLRGETEGKSDMLAAFMRHGLKREDLFTESWLQSECSSQSPRIHELMIVSLEYSPVARRRRRRYEGRCCTS